MPQAWYHARVHASRQPKYSGVEERSLAMINDTALATRIQAPVLYPGAPAYSSLWAEAVSSASHVLNRTATTAYSGEKSPYEMWHGSPPSLKEMWPFLKPAIRRVKRDNKLQPKPRDFYYVGPSVDLPRDCRRMLTAHRFILTTRNITWQHVPSAPPAPLQQLLPIGEEGESTARRACQVKAEAGWKTHDSLLEERLAKQHEWLEELERRDALLEHEEK